VAARRRSETLMRHWFEHNGERLFVDAILWLARTSAPWRDRPLPGRPDDKNPRYGRRARPSDTFRDHAGPVGRLPAGARIDRRADRCRSCGRRRYLRRRPPAPVHRRQVGCNSTDRAEPIAQWQVTPTSTPSKWRSPSSRHTCAGSARAASPARSTHLATSAICSRPMSAGTTSPRPDMFQRELETLQLHFE